MRCWVDFQSTDATSDVSTGSKHTSALKHDMPSFLSGNSQFSKKPTRLPPRQVFDLMRCIILALEEIFVLFFYGYHKTTLTHVSGREFTPYLLFTMITLYTTKQKAHDQLRMLKMSSFE